MSSPIERVRQLGARSWKPVVSLVAAAVAGLNGLKAAGVPLDDLPGVGARAATKWVLVAVGIVVFVIIRFPRVAFTVTRLILGPPPAPPSGSMIFRGPLPYGADEKLPQRQREIDACWILLQKPPMFILEGESGCGKSSLLNAALIPKAREFFTVVECRVAGDPFGRLLSALTRQPYVKADQPVSRESLANAIEAATGGGTGSAMVDSQTSKPLLVCIDQFEELFSTVKDEIRGQFVDTLKVEMKSGKLNLVMGIRTDFIDLLMKLSDSVDPERETITLGNYYTLRPFRRDQAEAVLSEMLAPVYAEDPLFEQQIESFTKALVTELLRPPRDKRLYIDDEKTVLPVELQTVGMMIESSGLKNLSVAGLRRLGGKLGLLKAYIEDAKTYVWRKTTVSGEKALLILRQLISPSQTKWVQTPHSIGLALSLPALQVKRVLDAFAERYLVNPLPLLTQDVSTVAAAPEQQYELMHDHLVQILVEAPDPVLQRANDAEERLRFWHQRTKSVYRQPTDGKPRSLRLRMRSLFAKPIPVFESISLLRFARSSEERQMLKRNLRGASYRFAVIALPIALPFSAWQFFIHTDWYQIQSILSDTPVYRVSSSDEALVTEWIRALANSGRIEDAIDRMSFGGGPQWLRTVDAVTDGIAATKLDEALTAARVIVYLPYRSKAIAVVAYGFSANGKPDEANRLFEEALTIARQIEDEGIRSSPLTLIAVAQAKAGRSENALAAAREIKSAYGRSSALGCVAVEFARAGKLTDAISVASETPDLADSDFVFGVVAESLAKAGKPEAVSMSQRISADEDRRRSLTVIAGGLSKAGRANDAKIALDEAFRAAGKIKSDADRSLALVSVADGFVALGRLDDANRALDQALVDAEKITVEKDRSPVFAAIGTSLARTGRYKEAQTAALKAGYDESLSLTIADALARAGDDVAALAVTNLIPSKTARSRIFAILAEQLAKFDKQDKVLAAALEVGYERPSTVAAVGEGLVKAGRPDEADKAFDRALGAARELDQYSTDSALNDVAEALARAGLFDKARIAASDVKRNEFRHRAFAAIANGLLKAGRVDDAKTALDEALTTARKIPFGLSRYPACATAAYLLIRAGRLSEAKTALSDALAAAQEILDDNEQSHAFANIAMGFAHLQAYRSARLASDRCSSADKLRAYTNILVEYAKEKNPSLRAHLDAR